jgi:hypothetical protein
MKRKILSMGNVMKWAGLGAALYTLVYFRGDLQRYAKMKMM